MAHINAIIFHDLIQFLYKTFYDYKSGLFPHLASIN